MAKRCKNRLPQRHPPLRDIALRLTAIIAARNEALYIGRCCEHLASQGIHFAVIDNDSTDDTRAIAESFRGHGLVCVVAHPYPGFYDWTGLLKHKEELARKLESDWFLHLDADEIPEPPLRHESLTAWLAAADAEGFNAVNFDEFVFVPSTTEERHEGGDYVQSMSRYFFFEPHPNRLIRAWRSAPDIELSSSGGHAATFINRRIYPKNFALRHYISLSMEHLLRKYLGERTYSAVEVANGWHSWRPILTDELLRVPTDDELCDIRTDQGWDKSRPCAKHLFIR
jgi:glycosyltransferase involved in cell wall biosynthesis